MIRARVIVCLVALAASSNAHAELPPSQMVAVGPGIWRPLYPTEGEEELRVEGFLLDVRPVTSGEFAAFVARVPKWSREKVPSLFAGPEYLSTLDTADPDAPVTSVSWWAARAYCADRDARLPREAEWELAAMASATKRDASKDPAFLAEILSWYSRPNSDLKKAGSGPANVWGVRDLHGQVWEWVDDFQSALVAVDNRDDGAVDTARFCGAGAVAAATKDDYAAFMRLAFRASLRAEFATSNLGFRCARDLQEEKTR